MLICSNNNYSEIDKWLEGKKKIFLVCGKSIENHKKFVKKLESINIPTIYFSDFKANPLYESVVKGVEVFKTEKCDCIIAVGGGSAIDVAKCIKLYAYSLEDGSNGAWLKTSNIVPNNIPFLVIPTTAGTGSEATKYAVVYYKGVKQSVTNESIIPDTVLIAPDTLLSLPIYQKKATMCDALCHAIESYWSVNSTDESKNYSMEAIRGIMQHMEGYFNNTKEGRTGMLMASNLAGKAINITQTTAGHAMCYKITSFFGLAHGHATILCNKVLFPWMIENVDKCIDPRGKDYLIIVLDELGKAFGGEDARTGAECLIKLFERLELDVPKASPLQYEKLKKGVNPIRLKNHPVELNEDDIDLLYHKILR